MIPRVFISYARSDREAVNHLEQTLQSLGVSVFRDINSFKLTDNLEERIKAFIEYEVEVLLVAVSNDSLASEWVERERDFAKHAQSVGVPIAIAYAKIGQNTKVPDDIQQLVYFDASKPGSIEYYESLMQLVQFFLMRKPYQQIGVYDVFESRVALNLRRENAEGIQGSDLLDFLCSAQNHVVGVGLWFATLFSPDTGKALKTLFTHRPDIKVELYVPHPTKAPLENLILTHEAGGAVQQRIQQFVDLFRAWIETLPSEDIAPKLSLHMLRFVPSQVMLCVDPYEVYGRMVVDNPVTAMGGEHQLKVELRYPRTPLYALYLDSLRFIQAKESIVESICLTGGH
jgi:hypothetical protein